MPPSDLEATHKKTRILSVVAATIIALACGTNYAYSAWATQFAERLQLSATQSNIIGTAGNMGMYAFGIPTGLITDRKGPRLAAFIGMFALGLGYFPIHKAYEDGPGSMSVGAISFFSFLTGAGSCAAFSGALKTATLNWPTHRGTATAFPLAGFGLSAFFYTLIADVAFPGDTSGFLLLLSLATSLLVLISIPFLHVVDHVRGTTYAALPTSERARRDSNVLHRTKSNTSKFSTSSIPEPEPDIIGLKLLSRLDFWQLFILMGLLTGVGIMTINNIGHDVQALWSSHTPSASKIFIAHLQLLHVSTISLFSFLGRLLSGIGSDIIVKQLHKSRFWCVLLSASIFALAQLFALSITDPHYLWLLSSLSGLAYGVLFGVLPALVVDAFGSRGFAVNWGFMTLAPVVSGNVYNLFYGVVYDGHSEVLESGERSCVVGRECYASAYWVTLLSSVVGIAVCFWGMREQKRRMVAEGKERAREA